MASVERESTAKDRTHHAYGGALRFRLGEVHHIKIFRIFLGNGFPRSFSCLGSNNIPGLSHIRIESDGTSY